MSIINVTAFKHVRDNNASNSFEANWCDLVVLLSNHETREEKDGPMFNGWKFSNRLDESYTRRCGENCDYNTLLILDYDGEMTIGEAKMRFKDYTYAAYTSYSHKTESKNGKDCFRIVFPMDSKVSLPEFKARKKSINAFAGACDGSSSDISRGFFLPSCSKFNIGMARHWSNTGKRVDVMAMAREPDKVYEATPCVVLDDSRQSDFVEALSKVVVKHEPTWWKIALAMASNGFTCEQFVALSVGNLMVLKTAGDAEAKWKKAVAAKTQVSLGFLVNLCKSQGVHISPPKLNTKYSSMIEKELANRSKK
jgi:hypothetical protein